MDPILEEKFHSIKEELEKAEEMQRQIINSYGVKVIEKMAVILFAAGFLLMSGAIGNHWLIQSIGGLISGATALLTVYPYKAAEWMITQELAILFFNGRIEQDIDTVCHDTAHRLKSYGAIILKQMKRTGDFANAEKAEEFISKFG